MKTLGKRLKECRADKSVSQSVVAKAVGMSQASISDLENDLYPTSTYTLKLATYYGVNPIWLESGRGSKEPYPMLIKGSHTSGNGNVSPTTIATRRVPLISLVAAGTWCEAMDTFQVGDGQEWIETTASITKSGYALRVEGDSMEPKFPHGAILIVDPNEQARNGSYVIVRQNGSDATFKQLVVDGGQSYLKPLNDRYPIMAMRTDAVICGVVKRVEMDV